MEEKKEQEYLFDDTDIEKKFMEAVKRGKESLKKGDKIEIPSFLLKPKDKKDAKK